MAVVATGTIADRPFGRTIATVAQRRFTGELRLVAGAQRLAIGFRDGLVVAAQGAHPADSAVKIALSAGLVTSTQASAILRAVQAGGDDVAIVGQEARLGAEQVVRLRRRVIANRAMRLFAVEAGEFVLDDQLAMTVATDLVPIDPRVVIFQAVRAHYPEPRTLRELASLGDTFHLREGLAGPQLAATYGFGDQELPALDALAARPLAPTALVQAVPALEPRGVLAALYALVVCGHAEVVTQRITPPGGTSASTITGAAGPRRKASTPPTRMPRASTTARPRAAAAAADIARIRALVRERAALAEKNADHFALLGVTEETPPDKVRAAYFEIARQLHPDRIVATGLEEIRAEAQRLFARVNAAFGILSHPAKRAEYIQTLRAGGEAAVRRREEEAEALAARLIAAEDHFRAGEMALRRNHYDVAIAEFQQAVQLNPDEAEHHAVLAWATWCAAPDKAAAAKGARATLDRASAMSPKNPVPHLLLGKIARALGDDELAAGHLRRCLEVAPGHGEASSELRIVEARLGKPPADDPKKPGGLFSRLKR